MKVEQTRTPEEFDKITRVEFYKLWFGARLSDNPMTLGQIAKMYGVDRATVKAKKKELHLTWLLCGFMYVAGGDRWKDPKPPKDNSKCTKKKKKKHK